VARSNLKSEKLADDSWKKIRGASLNSLSLLVGGGVAFDKNKMLNEEEQIELLGKMLLYSVDHMTAREREVYDMLVEGLSRRVSRLHRLEKQSERLKRPSGEAAPEVEDQVEETKKNVVKNLTPEDVVQLFIESWNTGDFEVEYFCLSRECTKGGRHSASLEDYIRDRKKKWENRHQSGIIRKRLTERPTSELKTNQSLVHCVEVHATSREEITLWREYQLIYEEGGWRISDFLTHRRSNRPLSSKSS